MTFQERTDYFQIDISEESASRRVLVDAQKVVYVDWKAERSKLIWALTDCCRMFKWCDDHYGAVLAEVTGEKKELPKFKDIIGLFVDKPEEDKG